MTPEDFDDFPLCDECGEPLHVDDADLCPDCHDREYDPDAYAYRQDGAYDEGEPDFND
ncbi:hypothetical protein ACSMXM_01190 [Pacificimonas sp. ICDLI1SI03]